MKEEREIFFRKTNKTSGNKKKKKSLKKFQNAAECFNNKLDQAE